MSINVETIKAQLPEHIREEYPFFVEFLAAYYEYMEENDPEELTSIRDADETTDEFITYLLNDIAPNVPAAFAADEATFIRNINSIYSAKGSEASYRFLFRALYDEFVSVGYPSEQLLIPSDGRWNQETSVFIKVTVGNLGDITGKRVILVDENGNRSELLVERVEIENIDQNVYEVFVDRRLYADIQPGNKISTENFLADVLPTTTELEVQQAGKGFREGQVFPVDSTKDSSLIKVTSTGEGGSIRQAKLIIINWKSGYDQDFNITLNPPAVPLGSPEQPAEIKVISGAYAIYPGYFSDNKGFLSDTIYLQDGRFYQKYSYTLTAERKLSTYVDVVKKLLHPAGLALFGIYDVRTDVDASASITSTIRGFVRRFFEDEFSTDTETNWVFEKPFTEDISSSEELNIQTNKALTDTTIPTDYGNVGYAYYYYVVGYADLDYSEPVYQQEQTF